VRKMPPEDRRFAFGMKKHRIRLEPRFTKSIKTSNPSKLHLQPAKALSEPMRSTTALRYPAAIYMKHASDPCCSNSVGLDTVSSNFHCRS